MSAIRTSLAMVFGVLCFVVAASADTKSDASFFTVDVYDPKRIADDDLKTTLAKAKAEGKHVLIQVGGDWCGWCHIMSKYFRENEKVAGALAKDFLIVKVNYSDENKNEEFLGKFPRVSAYPHLFVLDAEGKLLHSQNTADLEEGRTYNEKVVLDFLSKWKPKK